MTAAPPLLPPQAYESVTPPWRAFTLILPLRAG